jgi:hypothetical protein
MTPRISPLPQKCGVRPAKHPPGWQLCARKPMCNRPVGHQGPHREYNRQAAILHEWPTGGLTSTTPTSEPSR